MIDQEKLDRLATLLIDRTIAEFEEAAKSNTKLDPRRLANALRLLESANPKQLSPGTVDKQTGEVVPTPPLVFDRFKAAGRIVKLPPPPVETFGSE